MYVPQEHLPSIKASGYMSVRRLYESTGVMDTKKYSRQMKGAIDKYGKELTDTVAFRAASAEPDKKKRKRLQILAYLDWRSDLPHGSCAVYFLYDPVPNDRRTRQAVLAQRGWNVDKMVLMRVYYCSTRVAVETINGDGPSSASEWIEIWKKSILANKYKTSVLWLDGIPHGMFVPPGGLIPFDLFDMLN
jgi:hypothetical protein